ncbi:hypothetical protein [Nioella sediminis]|jgi:hypothetical protein|uniref:hypothetical protein n=1 Tax=Nioella sediminis TaxID=1912092 RepID=UPI0013140D96|nr:hypothetical protein [Nioella sediminis]
MTELRTKDGATKEMKTPALPLVFRAFFRPFATGECRPEQKATIGNGTVVGVVSDIGL